MDCQEALTLISERVDGEGDSASRAALDAHLLDCPACRETLEMMRQVDADLRRAFRPRREAAQAVAGRVIARLPSEGLRQNRLGWLPMLLSAAAGFLLAVIILERGGPLGEKSKPAPVDVTKAAASPAAASTAAKLAVGRGRVEVRRPGMESWEPLAGGTAVEFGSRVRTDAEGRCALNTPDGSEVRFNGATEVVFRTNRKLELVQGQLWSSVAHDLEPYQVKVLQAEATVTALGTIFDVQSSSTQAVLTVVQGTTRVNGRGPEELVEKGFSARIVGGLVAERRPVHDLVLATSWVKEILVLKGPEDQELAALLDDLFARLGEGKMTHLSENEIVSLGDHCVVPLTRYIQSDRSQGKPYQRVEAARILQKISKSWSIPYLIDLLSDQNGEVRYWAAKGLERLTGGLNQGVKPEEWRKEPASGSRAPAIERWKSWWKENRKDYPGPP
jgi:ferric-dicitrate binding protein FerR (iron transport regulator)